MNRIQKRRLFVIIGLLLIFIGLPGYLLGCFGINVERSESYYLKGQCVERISVEGNEFFVRMWIRGERESFEIPNLYHKWDSKPPHNLFLSIYGKIPYKEIQINYACLAELPSEKKITLLKEHQQVSVRFEDFPNLWDDNRPIEEAKDFTHVFEQKFSVDTNKIYRIRAIVDVTFFPGGVNRLLTQDLSKGTHVRTSWMFWDNMHI